MPRDFLDLAALEQLRETGNYDKIETALNDHWHQYPEFEEEAIRSRLLAAELSGRRGRVEDMEAALAPYLDDSGRVPFVLAARVMLTLSLYHYRRNEPSEALKLATKAKMTALVRDDEAVAAEAVQLEGQALWSLERWDDAAEHFRSAINSYAAQARPYRLGLAYLCLGAVLNRIGNVEEARTTLEQGIKILLKSRDEYNLAVARVNVASALNAIGEHDTALKYLEFAHETFERAGHEQYSYMTLNSIAATLVCLKEYDKAERYVEQALEMGARARSTQIASTYEIRGRVNIARRNFEAATRALTTAQEIAEQANSLSQKADVRRTLGRLYILQNRNEEASRVLWEALDIALELRATLLEIEIKSLLAQAEATTNPVEAAKLISDVEATLGARPLPELRKEAQNARRRINSLDQEQYFLLSDAKIPLLADAKVSLLKWLWARALHRARGNAREAASILGVTPTYIRKLTKVIPRDLLRPGRKRSKKR
jgi:tetratricopeptide (TPR) repeat protein